MIVTVKKIVFLNARYFLQDFGKIDAAKKHPERDISKFQISLEYELTLPCYLRQRQHKITVKIHLKVFESVCRLRKSKKIKS